jgi:hypothetical protein
MHYILRGRTPVPSSDPVQIEALLNSPARRVAEDQVDGVRLSTVFLCIAHGQTATGAPKLFETMAFLDGDSESVGTVARYATWQEAEQGHEDYRRRLVSLSDCAHADAADLLVKFLAPA